jgi:hypothetical protein
MLSDQFALIKAARDIPLKDKLIQMINVLLKQKKKGSPHLIDSTENNNIHNTFITTNKQTNEQTKTSLCKYE